jgi:hypothetical protein
MASDYTKSEADIIVDLIRQDNGRKPLTSSMVTFGTPNVYVPQPGVNRNTVVVVTARPGQTLEGSHSYYYNRVPLAQFVNPNVPDILDFVIEGETKLSELLPRINERLNINLGVSKIFDRDIPDFMAIGSAGEDIELKVTSNSLVFLNSIIIHVKPELIPLGAIIKTKVMSGLTYAPPA